MNNQSPPEAINSCEVCDSLRLHDVLDLGYHPLCDDLIPIDNQNECNKYPIEIIYCRNCFTAHQKYQVKKSTLFPQDYHYRSRFTADVLSGMDSLVASVESIFGSLDNKTVVDIGCNDGSLLDKFSDKGAKTIGVEPTMASKDANSKKHFIIHDFFNINLATEILSKHSQVDIITFTNVFAHIENLPALLDSVNALMNEDTILVVENHYLGSVLQQNQFDTFYHEHPRTYSLNSFCYIAKSLNREVLSVEFPKRYGGNIRVIIGKSDDDSKGQSSKINRILEKEKNYFKQFLQMNNFIKEWKISKKEEIKKLVQSNGKIIAKAFPGRAAILVTLLELSEEEIECVYEKPGSLKINNFVPGTRIPIRSDEELFNFITDTKVIINFAWHISSEIENYLRMNGFGGELIDII